MSARARARACALLALLVVTLLGRAARAEPVDVTAPGVVDLRPRAALVVDPSRALGVGDVARAEAEGRARPAAETSVHQGLTDAAYWLSATLVTRGPEPTTRWLRVFHTVDHVEVWTDDGRAQTVARAGRREPFDARAVSDPSLLFPVRLRPNEPVTVRVRLAGDDVIRLDLEAMDAESMGAQLGRRRLWWGLCYGMLAALGLYNLVLMFWLRERAHLYYVLFQGSLGLLTASFDQLTMQYLWPHAPGWSSEFETVAVMAAATGACGFARTFLATRSEPAPASRWLARCQIAALVLLSCFWLTDVRAYAILCMVFVLVAALTVLGVAVVAARRGVYGARYLVVAWSLLGAYAAVVVLSALARLDVAGPMELLRVGTIAEAALLSFALAQKVSRVRQENERMAEQMLRHRVESLHHLISGIVHEVANPLHFVKSGAELAVASAGTKDAAEALEIVQNGARRIDRILESLRTSQGKERPLEPTDVAAVVRDTLALMRHDLASHRVEVDVSLADVPLVEGRAGELGQVFANLFRNACQAMPEGGTLAVRAERARDGAVEIAVEDSGPGVPEELRSAIFDPFFTTRGPNEGTGLGLWVSLQILWSHGGDLRLDRTERGARFVVVLRRAT